MEHRYFVEAKNKGDLKELQDHLSMNGYKFQFIDINKESTLGDLYIDMTQMFEFETILKDRDIRFANVENLIAEAIEVIMKKVEDGTIPTCGSDLSFKERVAFEKRWYYQVRHFNSYKLGYEDEAELESLLNMLQANNETLDSLHNAAFNGHRNFMGIFGSWDNDLELAEAVREFNIFDSSLNSLATRIADNAFFNDETIEENLGNCELYKTHDGFVERLHY